MIASLIAFFLTAGSAPTASIAWQPIQPGVEMAVVAAPAGPLHVVRIDPRHARLQVALASEGAGRHTAADWCTKAGLAVAINLGMFQNDGRSNVGYLRHATHLNNPRWNAYRTVVALSPGVVWRDLDRTPGTADLVGYDVVVQNLRLITTARKNAWSPSAKRWSEAAIAIDAKGRLLFLFSRAPYTMHDFNELLLRLPLDVAGAMHVEGGPEASLSIHTATVNVDLSGSYETGFNENDANPTQWPIPNVLGVMR